VTEEADGHLRVRFRAGGIEEMAMHLITWGDAVEVLAPERLRQRMAEIGQGLVARYGGKAAGP
jgi:predicted DNA-binding transcriptional regulator YafY